MNPSTLERLGLRAPSGPQNRERAERAMAARTLMYVFLVGAVVAGAALISPVATHIDTLRLSITGGCSALIAMLLFAGYERLPNWTLSVFLLCGSMLIEWSVYAALDPSSPFLLFYLWVAFYAFYFLSRAQAAMQASFIGIAYAAVLVAAGESLRMGIVSWIVFMLALVVAGLLVRVMRERIDGLLESLDAASRTDMLTGLLDQQGFDEILEKELERARRSGNRVGLALARIDGEMPLRERLGERDADEILSEIGREIGGTIRLNDEGARIDDEYFVVVCPYTDERGTAIMAERIGTLVRERYRGATLPFTVSFGVASYPKHGTADDALLHAVRQSLDEARALGGDRTVTYFSTENSIEERLRGAGPTLDVIVTEPGHVEDGLEVGTGS
ncbi:MAG TPA: GGDEF domain-containing protein [Thermoleophilaceae bacterium]|nr:GGDEF domain-containing protein [Thermoleophilaceae bacterium]